MHLVAETTRFTRGKLPHWEVRGGRYFITVRCADSLPSRVVERLRAIHDALSSIEPRSPQFKSLQRRYFVMMEKYLDAGLGACRLADARAAQTLIDELRGLQEWRVDVPHYSVMPNHWHALIEPRRDCSNHLAEILRRVKGRTARAINAIFGQSGSFWQREWFDRWMRTDAERDRCIAYIQQNPVRAGIVRCTAEHPWTK